MPPVVVSRPVVVSTPRVESSPRVDYAPRPSSGVGSRAGVVDERARRAAEERCREEARRLAARRRRRWVAVWAVLLVAVLAWFVASRVSASRVPASSSGREPIATGIAFDNDCVIDELGWFDDVGKASRKLRNFYDETGIQPFVYLRAYDPSLTSDEEKTRFAEDWYEANIENESTFLFVYFAEENQDEDVGYMAYVNGKQVTSVMDAEAVNIFWSYVDNNWYTDKSTDQMFADIFDSTARRIMTRTATAADVLVKFSTVALVGTLVAGATLFLVIRRAHERERNEETERILSADIRTGSSGGDSSGGSGDETLDRWT